MNITRTKMNASNEIISTLVKDSKDDLERLSKKLNRLLCIITQHKYANR
jgi:hypothetical protein